MLLSAVIKRGLFSLLIVDKPLNVEALTTRNGIWDKLLSLEIFKAFYMLSETKSQEAA